MKSQWLHVSEKKDLPTQVPTRVIKIHEHHEKKDAKKHGDN